MSDERTRKSRRLDGQDPPPLPAAAVAKPRSKLKVLLATDCAHGRAVYGGDKTKAWNLDGASSVSSISMPSPFQNPSAAASRTARPDGFLCFGSTSSSEPADKSESVVESELPSDSYTKLIPFPKLKQMIECSCSCKYCGAPLTLRQETFGLATNLYLECNPPDGRWKKHTDEVLSDPMTPKSPNEPNEPADRSSRDSARKYLINALLVLAMH